MSNRKDKIILSPADASAAPAGYGLGEEQAFTVSDFNSNPTTWNTGKIGWLRGDSSSLNKPNNVTGVGILHRFQSGSSTWATLSYLGSDGINYFRTWNGTSWGIVSSVYTSGNKPTASDLSVVPLADVANGAATWADIINKIPKITSGGLLEVGSTIDMHGLNSTRDFDIRLSVESGLRFGVTNPNGSLLIGCSTNNVTLDASKPILSNEGVLIQGGSGGSWLDAFRNSTKVFGNSSALGTNNAQAIIRQKHADRTYILGGLGSYHFGFYSLLDSNTNNVYDHGAWLNSAGDWETTGAIKCNRGITTSGTITSSGIITTNGGGVVVSSTGASFLRAQNGSGAIVQLEVHANGNMDIATAPNVSGPWVYPLSFSGSGNVTVGGEFSVQGSTIGVVRDGRAHLSFKSADGTPHMYIYKDLTGPIIVNHGNKTQGGDFRIHPNGGVEVTGVLAGEDKFAFAASPQPGGWADWLGMAPGLAVSCPSANSAAYTVWKATMWGKAHIAAMMVHMPDGNPNNAVAKLRVGTSADGYSFGANGVAYAPGGWQMGSDISMKYDVVYDTDTQSMLKVVNNLKPAHFKYLDTDVTRFGFISQDVVSQDPTAVSSMAGSDKLALDPVAIIANLTGAIQELTKQVNILKEKII